MASGGFVTRLLDDTLAASPAVFDPADCAIQLEMNADGKLYFYLGGGPIAQYDWVLPNSLASGFVCRATVTAGSFTTGTFGSDLSLGTTRTWSLVRTTPGVVAAEMDLVLKFDGITQQTAHFEFTAEVNS